MSDSLESQKSWDVSSGPGITALGLAAARAVESSTPDRLIEDPFAAAFVDAAEVSLPMLVTWPEADSTVSAQHALHLHGSRFIGLRSRFYDDFVLGVSRDGVRQVVVLGAGLDARAYRLPWPPDARVFEVDQPGVLDFKGKVLSGSNAHPRCDRTPVGVDLRDDWPAALMAGGFDQTAATAWLAEGLVAYLPADAEERLLHDVNGLSAPGSQLALDRIVGSFADDGGARLRELSERSGIDMQQLINTETGTDIPGWLTEHGWTVDERPTEALADRYARDLGNPFLGQFETEIATGKGSTEPPWLNTVFLTALRP
jgi:methyltransferase (TIGR00027 family)